MKKLLILILLAVFAGQNSSAQFKENPILNLENEDEPLFNYGYFLGFNRYDFKFDYQENTDDILVDQSTGFNVGLIGEMRLNQFLDLRLEPGLLYNSRILNFPGFIGEDDIKRNTVREVKSTYINFPLLLKVSTKRFGNWKPFIIGGGSASLNLGSNEDSLDDNAAGTFRMKKWVYNYELGFGIDFYLEYFKFTPSIRGVFAITDELVRDMEPNSPWTGNLDAMRTRGIFVNFTFE